MRHADAKTIYLKDYQAPEYGIDTTVLHFELFEEFAVVESTLSMRRSPAAQELKLHGRDLVLEELRLNDRILSEDQYTLSDDSLTISDLDAMLGEHADTFNLFCRTRIEPQNNTALEGLYKSGRMFCTQCEAEGFRRITYYLDRPDVMSRFTTTIVADAGRYPTLLSNGNCIARGTLEGDPSRHWVRWEDPFKKPSYLFALVAGALEHKSDSFTTSSGREVTLQIFVEQKDLDKIDYAMDSLKRAMRWDEEVYGREYDLDIFMIVAVDDFNMGAMENKGLNIFNTSCVLANPLTQSDQAFQRVEAVVAHEYFHNWSGNRVTCRDWFQLSLKEGFTVFRDAEFSADMGSRTVKRVEDVSFLRAVQFAEDAGPMAHSVRPDSYMEISNFYTVTIYEKGAEVVRMISLLTGPEAFRRGSDLYFERHDGEAVTTEDFVLAMEEASGVDLQQFRRWYSQAGTPVLTVTGRYSESDKTFTLQVKQSCPATPGQPEKQNFHIPLRMALLDQQGKPLVLSGAGLAGDKTDEVLHITDSDQEFTFTGIEHEPVPSLLRGFSAPVRLNYDYSQQALALLISHDEDGFNRWNASQALAMRVLQALQSGEPVTDSSRMLLNAYREILSSALADEKLDRAMLAHLLSLPQLSALIEQAEVADVESIYQARESLLTYLASELAVQFAELFEAVPATTIYRADADSIANRALRNLCLSYLLRGDEARWAGVAYQQFQTANNMTDQLAALRMLVAAKQTESEKLSNQALEEFYKRWRDEPLVVDQWLSVQAIAQKPGALSAVKALIDHPAFEFKNPNKVRALIGAFCSQNHLGFHDASGAGYEFLAEQVIALDSINPQIAARLLTPLTRWKKYDANRQRLMQAELLRIKSISSLSKDVYEVVEKSTINLPA
ncbi:MAG: aminopeptidase N [Pseudomonadota bacterium]|nr:aminopeptidase N [Pseudomonadota bacterium]